MQKQTMVLIVSIVLAGAIWMYLNYQKHAHLEKHPALQQEYWNKVNYSSLPIEKRIFDVSPAIVDYLTLDNFRQGRSDRPKPFQLSPEQRAIVEDNLRDLPESMKEKLKSHLGGIVFVRSFGGSVVSNPIFDSNGKPIAGFIALDEMVFQNDNKDAFRNILIKELEKVLARY